MPLSTEDKFLIEVLREENVTVLDDVAELVNFESGGQASNTPICLAKFEREENDAIIITQVSD